MQLYVSPVPDPQAIGVDALSLSWKNMHAYAFPPTPILLKVLRKLENEEGCRLVLIAPDWPKQSWYPLLQALSIDRPRRLPVTRRLLKQPGTQVWHPQPEMFRLHAWLLSSNKGSDGGSQRKLHVG